MVDNYKNNNPFRVNQYGDNSLFVNNNEGVINISMPDGRDFEDIKHALDANSPLRYFAPSIKPEIKRKEEDDIIRWIEEDADKENPCRVGFVTGAPGIGKTALTNSIYSRLNGREDCLVWGFKADQIRFEDVHDLEGKMHLFMPLSEAIRVCADNRKRVVVIVDQIDALSLSLSSNRTPLTSLSLFIRDISRIPRVRVIVSCRAFDLKYDNTLASLNEYSFDTPTWTIGKLSPDEVKSVLVANNLNSDLDDKTIDSLGNPQLLSLYLKAAEFHRFGVDDSSSIDLNHLYDILWSELILKITVTHIRRQNLLQCIDAVLDEMYNSQRISIPAHRLSSLYQEELSYLCSSDILRYVENQIQFSHQTWFEYAYARRFVDANKSLIQELDGKHQGLFVRSQVASVLQYCRTHDSREYVKMLRNILFDVDNDGQPAIRFHLKVLAISGLLYQKNPSPAETRLIKETLQKNKPLGVAVINAAHTPEWMDIVLDAVRDCGGWQDLPPVYRNALIGSLQNMSFLYCDYFFDVQKSLFPLYDEQERDWMIRFLNSCSMKADPEKIMDFYKFLQKQLPGQVFPNMLVPIAGRFPEFAAEEIIKAIEEATEKSSSNHSSHIRVSHLLELAFENIEKTDPILALELCINALYRISEISAWEIQLHKVKKVHIFIEFTRCANSNFSYDTKEYLFNHIIDVLEAWHEEGKEIWPYINELLHYDVEPLVYAGLCVLNDYYADFKDRIFELLAHEGFLDENTTWIEYGVCEVLRHVYPVLDADQQTELADKILAISNPRDAHLCFQRNKDLRMEYGLPLTFEGWRRGVLLNVLPKETLKERSIGAYNELERLKRRFKQLDNQKPISTSSHVGWSVLPHNNIAKMDLEAWRSSMLKFVSDHNVDFSAPTLTGQANAFRDVVAENPDKFYQFILEIIDDERISMKYLLAGFEGLLNAKRYDQAQSVFGKFEQWIGNDIENNDRDFSLHSLLFILTKLIPSEDLPEWIFNFICRVAIEKDDSSDMDNFAGSDIVTHSINKIRGNAVYNLVRCAEYDGYEDRIFGVLESIAETAGVSTRAAALINMAILNNVDKNRNLQLFKKLLHDFNPILMSLPVHNLNPLVYFINYGFDELIDYFEQAVRTPQSYRSAVVLLWLAWKNKRIGKAKELLAAMCRRVEAQTALLSFFYQQDLYDDCSIEFILKFLNDCEVTSELAQVYDGILNHFPVLTPAAEQLAKKFSESGLAAIETHGYINFLKRLAAIKPRVTLHCVNELIGQRDVLDKHINDITEILLTSYNGIKEYDDPELKPELEKAIDLLDSLMESNAAPQSMNQFIRQLDND